VRGETAVADKIVFTSTIAEETRLMMTEFERESLKYGSKQVVLNHVMIVELILYGGS
jgi:hypothetical protein